MNHPQHQLVNMHNESTYHRA